MIKTLLSVLDQIEVFWKKRSTVKALGFFALIANLIFISLFSISYFILTNMKYFDSPLKFKNYIFFLIGFWAFLNFTIIIVWIFFRVTPQFAKSKIGIIFGPHSDPKCNDLIFQIYDRFKLEIKRRNLSSLIAHKILPQNKNVLNQDDAFCLINKSGARLVIYGIVHSGYIKNEKVEGFKSISFTVRHRTLEEAEKNLFYLI